MRAAARYAAVATAEYVAIFASARAELVYRWLEDWMYDTIRARDRLRPWWWPAWVVEHERPGVQHFSYGLRDRRSAWSHARRFATTIRPEPDRPYLSEPVPAVRARVVRHFAGRRAVLATFEPDTIPEEARGAAGGGLRPVERGGAG